jgi:hypothetical protein
LTPQSIIKGWAMKMPFNIQRCTEEVRRKLITTTWAEMPL